MFRKYDVDTHKHLLIGSIFAKPPITWPNSRRKQPALPLATSVEHNMDISFTSIAHPVVFEKCRILLAQQFLAKVQLRRCSRRAITRAICDNSCVEGDALAFLFTLACACPGYMRGQVIFRPVGLCGQIDWLKPKQSMDISAVWLPPGLLTCPPS